MSFNFGSSGSKNLFGPSASSTANTGFSFGANPANKTTATAFTFPTAASTASTGFGFGAKTTASGLFGNTTGFSGFGAKSTSSSLFGSGFGNKTTTTAPLFSGTFSAFSFPNKTDASKGLFGQQQQQQQAAVQGQSQENAASILLATATALSAPHVFGDERDAIMTKWNQIQAFWGVGRGFYRKDGAHIPFTPQNHFCRFKAVGYSCLPTAKDDEGFVSLISSKKESEVKNHGEAKIEDLIHRILGSSTSLKVKIDALHHVPNEKCEIILYVTEQSSTTGHVRRVPASELHRFMMQPNIQQQLKQQLFIEACMPRAIMSEKQIGDLISHPPSGIDPVVWEQAKRDNPDPKTLIPVPMIGFSELRNRLRLQDEMSKQHQSRLDILSKKLHDMQQEQVSLQSKSDKYKRKLLELSHRLLQVVVAQEICRKSGYAIQPEEEQLRVRLESLHNELNAPTQFRGRLNELLSQTRLQHYTAGYGYPPDNQTTSLDEEALRDISKHLRKQQEGLNTLVSVLREDMNDLKLIESGLMADDGSQQYYGLR